MRYRAVLFDLDDTLLDFGLAEELAFAEAHRESGIEHPLERVRVRYREVNRGLWAAFEAGRLRKEEVVVERFRAVLREFGGDAARCVELNETYLSSLAGQGCMRDGAVALLDALRPRYALGVVTNGVQWVQERRVAHAGLAPYFRVLLTSEAAGVGKPDPAIFHRALAEIGVEPHDALYVGDNPRADVAGALGAGLDACWYDPAGAPYPPDLPEPTLTIRHLSELAERL